MTQADNVKLACQTATGFSIGFFSKTQLALDGIYAPAFHTGAYVALIALITTVAQVAMHHFIDTYRDSSWEDASITRLQQGVSAAIYTAGAITPLALGMIGPMATTFLFAGMAVSWYYTYIQLKDQPNF